MKNCYQFKTLSVLGHGVAVMRKARKIINKDLTGFKMPDWFIENIDYIIQSAHDWKIIKRYTIWHDCGKPFCRIVDAEGKQHFPNHEQKSKETFDSFSDNKLVSNLIGNDMLLHTAKSEDLDKIILSKADWFTLIIVSFAELHANADMFGGVENTSFKIKWKQLDKRGKQVLKNFQKSV